IYRFGRKRKYSGLLRFLKERIGCVFSSSRRAISFKNTKRPRKGWTICYVNLTKTRIKGKKGSDSLLPRKHLVSLGFQRRCDRIGAPCPNRYATDVLPRQAELFSHSLYAFQLFFGATFIPHVVDSVCRSTFRNHPVQSQASP